MTEGESTRWGKKVASEMVTEPGVEVLLDTEAVDVLKETMASFRVCLFTP